MSANINVGDSLKYYIKLRCCCSFIGRELATAVAKILTLTTVNN